MADAAGRTISGRTTIPVKEMALQQLDKIIPHATPDQIAAMRGGKPIPPSPTWIGNLPMSQAVHTVVDEATTAELRAKLAAAELALRLLNYRSDVTDARIAETHRYGPSVTALLVFSDPKRLKRARRAVNQFVAQSYPHKQIVVVNASDVDVTNVPHKAVLEVKWAGDTGDLADPTTGAMRNFGLDHATGDLVFPFWDDDDVYDRDLLTTLVEHAADGRAVALTSQIRVDIVNSTAYLHVESDGVPNALLCPASAARFEDRTGGEDFAFWQRHWGMKTSPFDNSAWPLNALLMRVHDGNNVAAREAFMVGHATPGHRQKWAVGANVAGHMKAVLTTFGLKVEHTPPAEQPAVA